MSELSNDPFEDETKTSETDADKGEEDEGKKADSEDKGEPDDKKDESDKQGEDDKTAEPPVAGDKKNDTAEKMIPESRFKAAIKDVSDKLEKAQSELNQMKATPPPDPVADPEGHNLHLRVEISKQAMMDAYPDYAAKIAHFQALAKDSPHLNDAVAASKNPAKLAYDIAAKDMEIAELMELKGSDTWKKFQEFSKTQAAEAKKAEEVQKKPVLALAPKVPNLNRSPDVSRSKEKSGDDDLFADSKLDGRVA